MALLGRQPSGAYFFRACRTSRRMASDRLGKSGCSRRQSSTAARSSGVAIAQASGAKVNSRSLHGSIRSRTVSLRRRCASGHLLRQRSLAVQATEAPLPPDPHLVLSGEQCAHPEIRAHHGASSVRSYLLVGRLPSHDLVFSTFHPAKKRRICFCHRARKRKLGSRKNANRNPRIFCRSKPARAGTKVACGEFVANLCRPRPTN